MKLCLPRKARSLAESQLSRVCAKQIAERGRGRPGCILPQEAGRTGPCGGTKNISGHRGGRLGGRSGNSVLFCEMSGVVPWCRPPGGRGTRQPAGAARAGARSTLLAQRRTAPRWPAWLCCPPPLRARQCAQCAHLDLKKFFFFKFFWLI